MTPHSSQKTSLTAAHSKGANSPEPKQPCRVTVTAAGWHGARTAAIAAGCSSVSDMLEKLGRGELAIIASDAIALDPLRASPMGSSLPQMPVSQAAGASRFDPAGRFAGQHIHIHPPAAFDGRELARDETDEDIDLPVGTSLPRWVVTGLTAAVMIGAMLYVADRIISLTTGSLNERENIEAIVTPHTGEVVAGYEVSDEYGIRPFHPVTGEPNAPHNGVDLAMPIGTPIHGVGQAGDRIEVECWWDADGGGWVVDQTTESYPGYVFQSLHLSDKGCRPGKAKAGEVIAFSGNSGLGTGAHYDFRVKIDGQYVPPATRYLEAAVTGKPPRP